MASRDPIRDAIAYLDFNGFIFLLAERIKERFNAEAKAEAEARSASVPIQGDIPAQCSSIPLK